MNFWCSILNNSVASKYIFCAQIDLFTVVCSVTWSLNGSYAGGDLFLIYRPYCVCCVNQVVLMPTSFHLFKWEKQRGLYQIKVPSSLACIHREGHWAHNCKNIAYYLSLHLAFHQVIMMSDSFWLFYFAHSITFQSLTSMHQWSNNNLKVMEGVSATEQH